MASGLINLCGKELEAVKVLASNPLPIDFYNQNTVQVAQDLLGKILIVKSDSGYPLEHPQAGLTLGRIVETEAYRGDDPASHSCRGETPRSSIMFGSPGVAYVYFIYGMYEMLNCVTEPNGYPGAVLIRAVEPLGGEALMVARRKRSSQKELASGPGRLCQAMGIKMSYNGTGLQGPLIYICDDGFKVGLISQSSRIGIRVGIEKQWRFFLNGNLFVSRVRQENR